MPPLPAEPLFHGKDPSTALDGGRSDLQDSHVVRPGPESFVVAAIVDRTVCDGENHRSIAACRPGERQGAWWRVTLAFDLQHILFHEGKLHALRSCDHLVVFDDGKLSSGSR